MSNDFYFKDFLTEKGLSQYRVRKDTGLNAVSINRWCKGYKMSAESAVKLKKTYHDFDLSKIRPDLWS